MPEGVFEREERRVEWGSDGVSMEATDRKDLKSLHQFDPKFLAPATSKCH